MSKERAQRVAFVRNGNEASALAICAALVAITGGTAVKADEQQRQQRLSFPQLPEMVTQNVTAEDSIVLDPIVISGEKAEREYTDTFTSVGVATGEELEEFGVEDMADAFNRMANVRWNDANGGNNGFTIRGVNSEGMISPENNTPVASVIIDGATQSVESARRGSRGIWDVKQIEVLRGPQSLLQGRAAMAGAVVVETNDPTFTPEYGFEATVGSDDRREAAFYVSGPVVPGELALRFSGETRQSTAEIDYDDSAFEDLADDEYRNLRGKLLWTPAAVSGLEVLLTVSDTYDKPADRTVTTDFSDREFEGDPENTELREGTNRNYVADISYDIDGYLKLESVTAWVDAQTDISTADDYEDVYYREDTRNTDDFTQDVRLVFGDVDDTLSGVVGLFYGNFEYSSDSSIDWPGLDLSSFGFPGYTLDLLVPGGNLQQVELKRSTEQWSAYADLRYRVTEQAMLLVGGRYLHETVETTSSGEALDTATLIGSYGTVVQYNSLDYDGSTTYTEFLPSLGMAYDITETQSVALTAKKGYRSGYVEISGGEINEVDPEYVWTYELAYRQEALDGRWLFGANVFYNDYEDQQIPVAADGIYTDVYTVNAGNSHSYGAEFEGRYRMDNGLSVFGSLGLLKTEFDDLKTAEGNFEGNDFPEAPQTTASLGVLYQHVSGLFAAADATYTSSYYSSGAIDNDSELKVDSYTVANLSVGYAWDNYKLTAYVDNVLDEDYVTSLDNDSFGGEPTLATIGDGRNFGVTFAARF